MNEVIDIEPAKSPATSTALAAVPSTTPAALLAMAVQQGADLDKLERLMALQERWEANEARNAYNKAFSGFKAEAVKIIKNRAVTAGPLNGKKYAELFAVVNAVTPALSMHGLSASWVLSKDAPDWIEVTCILKHDMGHAERVSMGGPPDTGGAKNAIQARASTVSYLERYTLKAILGLSEQEDDDDGGKGVENADPLEVWAGRAALAATEDELRLVAKDGAQVFKAARNVDGYKLFAAAVQARGAELKGANHA